MLIFLTGVLATTIGTLAGGGGFISFPMLLLLGTPIHSAIAANKVSNTISSFSTFFYLFRHKKISLKESFWIIPVSLGGGISGGFIASRIHEDRMYLLAITFLLATFIISFIRKDQFSSQRSLTPNYISIPGLYGIGIYDGLFGPGQGTLMMQLFGFLKVAYIQAVGYVRLATFSSCCGAAITYLLNGHVLWPTTLCLLFGSLTGAQIGVRVAEKLKPKYVKPLLKIVTFILIIQIILQQI